MAYKLYINNKLFNGIGNNNYNKGTIAINGTVYQFDNSSSVYVPTDYDYDFTDRNMTLPNYITNSYGNSNSSKTVDSVTINSLNYTSARTTYAKKIESSPSLTFTLDKDGVVILVFATNSTDNTSTFKVNDAAYARQSFESGDVTITGSQTWTNFAYIEINAIANTQYTIKRNNSEMQLYFMRITM